MIQHFSNVWLQQCQLCEPCNQRAEFKSLCNSHSCNKRLQELGKTLKNAILECIVRTNTRMVVAIQFCIVLDFNESLCNNKGYRNSII